MAIASLLVAPVALIGALFGFRQSYRVSLRQFEEKYVQRHWSILDGLSLKALRESSVKPDADDEKVIRRYILLCEDQLEMRKNGCISDTSYYE